MSINATSYNSSWLKTKNYLMDPLVCIPTRRFTLTYYLTRNWYTTDRTWFLVSMNKHSKRNSNTWLTLEFSRSMEPPSGTHLASLLPRKTDGSDKSLISALSTNASSVNNICCLLSMILCNGSQDSSFHKT